MRDNSAVAELSRRAQVAAAAAMTSLSESIANVTKRNGDGDGFAFLDNVCRPVMEKCRNVADEDDDDSCAGRKRGGGGRDNGGGGDRGGRGRIRRPLSRSYDDDDETEYTEDDTYADDPPRNKRSGGRNNRTRSDADDESNYTGYTDEITQDDATYDDYKPRKNRDDDNNLDSTGKLIQQPLASGFAKRCYFTKAGIGRTTQHYEGLTLTGNTILMLASAMNLKGCPTICDEDLRRVEQTYPNQFSRLPDELLLSSGWRRISKYCHFSHKPLPDGVPFFHSRKRCHPSGGFYFLLCSAVGMVRLIDVELLSREALIVLQTDFPLTCEKAPKELIEDPNEWTLVNKFCFFSGGPINVDEDVYYKAELSGNEIYMLAFLSPSLSPEELYRLKESPSSQENTGPLKSVKAVEEVESVYDLTPQDFDDLKLYHLGPCRALPPHLLNPEAWTKVLPPPFASAREEALMIARDWESRFPQSQPVASVLAPLEEKKAKNMTSGYVEFGGTVQMKQQSLSQDPNENHYQKQMHQQHVPPGNYPYQYPHGQMHQQGMMQDPNGYYKQPQARYPPQYGPQQYGVPPMEKNPNNYSGGIAKPSYHYSNHWREVEEDAGWDQPHDEVRGNLLEPDGAGSSHMSSREDPSEAEINKERTTLGGSRLKQMAMKKMETKSPTRSLASKLAAKRAMLVDDADESTLGDSTIGNSTIVSEATTDLSYSERNSRRALILQMAKARMMSVKKENVAEDPAEEGKADVRNETPPSAPAAVESEDQDASRDISIGVESLDLD